MPIFITPEIRKAFTDLGWPEFTEPNLGPYDAWRSATEPSIYVRQIGHRRNITSTHKLVVECDHKDAVYTNKIDSIALDMSKPKWVQSLFRWHAATTFKLAEIRAQHAERDQREARNRRRREAHTEELKAMTGNTNLLHAHGCAEDGSFTSIRINPSVLVEINDGLARLRCINSEAKRGAELIALLKSHGFIA